MHDKADGPIAKSPIGRRLFLGLVAFGAGGIVFGESVQNLVSTKLGSGLASLLPGGDHFRIYSITGTYPLISTKKYQLEVSGLVDKQMVLSFDDLRALPSIEMVKTFQCVTGWRVPNVSWKGVQLSHLLAMAGVQSSAIAVSFESYDGMDTESLTLDEAHIPDVIVAYEMYGKTVSREHGGPVRLVVPQMYGYKSLKWLKAIRVADQQQAGFWEQNGYPVNGWLDGWTGPTNPNPNLS